MRCTSLEDFWRFADTERLTVEYMADKKLMALTDAPLDVVRSVLVQYRFFTTYYIDDLAQLVGRVPFGRLKSVLAEILNDELGNGDPGDAHPELYDRFLVSFGLSRAKLDGCADLRNISLLEEIQQLCVQRSVAYAIGLRGLGGECLCQVYLAALHAHFSKNPLVEACKAQLDWKFWDIHTGQLDIAHRVMFRDALQELVRKKPEMAADLMAGYQKSKEAWDTFWDNIFATTNLQAARARSTSLRAGHSTLDRNGSLSTGFGPEQTGGAAMERDGQVSEQ